jgi:hypothetical protein
MSFGRLLAAGKSLVSGDVAGRYRMRKHIRLPKFISPRNPFKAEPADEVPPAPPLAPATMAAAAPGAVVASAPRISFWARCGAALLRAAVYCLDHNPFSRLGRSKLAGIPHFGKAPVQPELSLENVKVVRGDLTAADLEGFSAPGDSNRGPGAAWRALTTRVFGGEAR